MYQLVMDSEQCFFLYTGHTLADDKMARDKHKSCLCPTDKFRPLSSIKPSKPPNLSIIGTRWDFRKTSQICRSECLPVFGQNKS